METSGQFHARDNILPYPLDDSLGGIQNRPERCGEEKNT
jgi:hypothetical protein